MLMCRTPPLERGQKGWLGQIDGCTPNRTTVQTRSHPCATHIEANTKSLAPASVAQVRTRTGSAASANGATAIYAASICRRSDRTAGAARPDGRRGGANCCRSKRAFPQGSSHLGEPHVLLCRACSCRSFLHRGSTAVCTPVHSAPPPAGAD